MMIYITLVQNLLYGIFYDALKWIYNRNLKSFDMTLKTQAAMHGHGGLYELMFEQEICNRELKKLKIFNISHEIGYPKLEKITSERGSHTRLKLPLTISGEESETIRVTYNMKKGIPEKCKVRTIISHNYGTYKKIERVSVSFK